MTVPPPPSHDTFNVSSTFFDNYSKEECVNADTALHRGGFYPNCMVYWLWNATSWNKINRCGEDAEACDTVPGYRSTDLKIVAKKPDQLSEQRPSNTPVPNRGGFSGADAADGRYETSADRGGRNRGTFRTRQRRD